MQGYKAIGASASSAFQDNGTDPCRVVKWLLPVCRASLIRSAVHLARLMPIFLGFHQVVS